MNGTRGLFGISTDPEVLGTNVGLALLIVILIVLVSELFNQTIASNRREIEGYAGKFTAPFRGLGGLIGPKYRVAAQRWPSPRMRQVAEFAVIMLLTGLIYTSLEGDIGFDLPTAFLFGCLVVAMGAVTYAYSGGQARIARRRFGVRAGVKLYGLALAIAVLSVGVSHLIDFKPGFIFGFVATYTLLSGDDLDSKQEGQAVFWPVIALLAMTIAAGSLVNLVRELEGASDAWGWNLAETASVTVFWAGLQGAFFNMIPITFMDGEKLKHWNRNLWFAVFGTSTFLFVAALLNPEKAFGDSLEQTRVWAFIALCVVSSVITALVWLYFRYRRHGRLLPAMPPHRREGP